MFTLRLLGAVDLRGADGRRVASVLSQPKRLALLALMALEAPDRLQREAIMGRLWPESSGDRARNSLRQSLHYLRRSLGPGVITGKGEEGIGIAVGKLECDAAQLIRASAEGRFQDMLDLYRGELLPGFHLDGGSAAFEHWLEDSRRRLRRLAAEAARQVAEERESSGDPVGAGRAARRAWELSDGGEPGLRELLDLLVRTGDISGARAAYQEFADRLLELGSQPAPETTRIVEALEETRSPQPAGVAAEDAAEGSRASPRAAPAAPAAAGTGEGSGRERPTRWRWAAAGTALAACLVAVLTLVPFDAGDGEGPEAMVSGPPVLYLEPVRDLMAGGELPGLAESLGTELAQRLNDAAGMRVVLLGEGPTQMADEGVRLRPSVRRLDHGLQLSVLLLDPGSDAVLDRLTVDVESAGASAEVLAGRMVPRIRHGVGEVLSLRGLAKRGIDPDALATVRAANEELEAAVGLRNRGAPEAAALAFAAADSLLARATAIDPSWLEPKLRRAEIALKTLWMYLVPPNDRPELAHREVLRGLAQADAAVASDRTSGRALESRGLLHYWAARTALDSEEKASFERAAERDLEAAVRLDPGLPRAWNMLSALAEGRGEFASAYHRARQAYRADYALRVPTDILARLYTNALEVGDVEGAAVWCAEIHQWRPDHWLGSYCDLTRRAWAGPWVVAESDSILGEGLDRVPRNAQRPHLEARFQLLHAVVLARAGETTAARRLLADVEDAGPNSVDVLDLRAWAWTALGENNRAQRLLASAVALNPDAGPSLYRSRRYTGFSSYTAVRSDR